MLEVIVTNVDDALNAEKGGANRLEIVREPNQEGLTPSIEIVKRIRDSVWIPMRVMVRDKNTFTDFKFVELKEMSRFINQLSKIDVQGVVVGFLTNEKKINFDAIETVLEYKNNLEVTFHRAIDDSVDIIDSIKELIKSKLFDRILTSGGAKTAYEGIKTLKKLNSLSSDRIKVIAGGSISAGNIRAIKKETGVTEYHVGRSVRNNQDYCEEIDPLRVKEIIDALH
ncbi:MAG: copper homeostasis protein CutC [Ignavibacteriaceae bacterium]